MAPINPSCGGFDEAVVVICRAALTTDFYPITFLQERPIFAIAANDSEALGIQDVSVSENRIDIALASTDKSRHTLILG